MEYIIITICLIIFIWFIVIYNGIRMVTNKVNEGFATMDVYLKQRYNLVPNLVETVKQYSDYEKETLENITDARAKASQSNDANTIIANNNRISEGLGKLFMVAEAYPNLKANINYIELQKELTRIEEDIANARKYYNGAVREYNNYITIFPNILVASIFKVKERVFFSIDAAEKEVQNIKFLGDNP